MRTAHRMIPALCLMLACAGYALAQGPGGQAQSTSQPWMQFEKELGLQTTYSVDMSMQMMGMNMDSRVARDGGKTRTEMTMPMMNLKMVGLEIPEVGKSVSYSLFPDNKKYVLNEDASGAVAAAQAAKPQIEELGTETYEGVACVKRRVTMVQQGIRSEMIMLFSPKQKNMPVKMTMTANLPAMAGRPATPIQSTILFKNYDFSTPAAALFAIPADYAKAESVQAIIMESMGNLGAMMKQMQPPPRPAK